MNSIRKNVLVMLGLVIGMLACLLLSGCANQAQTGKGLNLKLGGHMELGLLENSTLNSATASSADTDNSAMNNVASQPSALSHVRDQGNEDRQGDSTSSWNTRF